MKRIPTLKTTLPPLLALAITATTQASITYTGLSPTAGSTVDVSDGATATNYNGTWTESVTGATGTWTIDITFDGGIGEVLTWAADAGTSVAVGTSGTGGGLLLDFIGPNDDASTNTLTMAFSMTVDPGASLTDNIYSVGPGNGSWPDWGTANVNTGGAYTADTGGGQNANYNSGTGAIAPTPAGGGTSNHDWYIGWSAGTTITWSAGRVQTRDTHVFGASEVTVVPEPSSSLLLLLGGFAAAGRRRR